MSTENIMSFAHTKYFHNANLCAQIYCINSDFIDVSHIPICDGFEILENPTQSVAPSTARP